MTETNRTRRKLVYIISAFGLAIFLSWAVFNEYARINFPTNPDPASGRLYQKNYHGQIVYMSNAERTLDYLLPALGISMVILNGFILRGPKPSREK